MSLQELTSALAGHRIASRGNTGDGFVGVGLK